MPANFSNRGILSLPFPSSIHGFPFSEGRGGGVFAAGKLGGNYERHVLAKKRELGSRVHAFRKRFVIPSIERRGRGTRTWVRIGVGDGSEENERGRRRFYPSRFKWNRKNCYLSRL